MPWTQGRTAGSTDKSDSSGFQLGQTDLGVAIQGEGQVEHHGQFEEHHPRPSVADRFNHTSKDGRSHFRTVEHTYNQVAEKMAYQFTD